MKATWYHVETTLEDGTTWKSASPLPTWAHVLAWLHDDGPESYGQPIHEVRITYHSDLEPEQ